MWLKLDDQAPDHPKFANLTDEQCWLWFCGLCYCGRFLTDGFIPHGMLPRIAKNSRGALKNASRLVEVGLWEPHEDGFIVHDYLDYNPSADTVHSKRQKKVESGRQGGFAKAAKARGSSDGTTPSDVAEAVATGVADAMASAMANATAESWQNSAPSPSPSPSPTPCGPEQPTHTLQKAESQTEPLPGVDRALDKWAQWQAEKWQEFQTPTDRKFDGETLCRFCDEHGGRPMDHVEYSIAQKSKTLKPKFPKLLPARAAIAASKGSGAVDEDVANRKKPDSRHDYDMGMEVVDGKPVGVRYKKGTKERFDEDAWFEAQGLPSRRPLEVGRDGAA